MMARVPPATQPVVWTALGYPFEAASMLAGLGACLIVRVWICLKHAPRDARTRALDLTVTGIALLFTAGWVVLQRPSPFYALLSGCGFGALGRGIIALSLKWVRRLDPLAADDLHQPWQPHDETPPQVDDVHAHARPIQPARHKRKHRDGQSQP